MSTSNRHIVISQDIADRFQQIKLIPLSDNELEIYLDIALERLENATDEELSKEISDIITEELNEYA